MDLIKYIEPKLKTGPKRVHPTHVMYAGERRQVVGFFGVKKYLLDRKEAVNIAECQPVKPDEAGQPKDQATATATNVKAEKSAPRKRGRPAADKDAQA